MRLADNDHDPVDHPRHYTQGAIECIDAIEACLTHEEFVGALRFQIMKYTWRLGLKGAAEEDAGKIAWYADRLEQTLAGRVPTHDDIPAFSGETKAKLDDYWTSVAAEEAARDWKPITAEEVKRARDLYRAWSPTMTEEKVPRPLYATRVYDLDGNMRLTYPPFEFNWDAITPGNDWVAKDPYSGDVYSYEYKPRLETHMKEWFLHEDVPENACIVFERNFRDALPDGVFLIERVRLDG